MAQEQVENYAAHLTKQKGISSEQAHKEAVKMAQKVDRQKKASGNE